MDFLFKYIFRICFLLLLFSFGCVSLNTPSQDTEPLEKKIAVQSSQKEQKIKINEEIYFIHIVKWDGESMSLIARWYIGNYEDWKLIAKHNPGLNPKNIHVKDKVLIPKNKMKTSEQMPESFLNQYIAKKKIELKKKKETFDLYGPKEHEE